MRAHNLLRYQIADGSASLIDRYNVKTRRYIGTTTMDAELSLLVANQALVSSNHEAVLLPYAESLRHDPQRWCTTRLLARGAYWWPRRNSAHT